MAETKHPTAERDEYPPLMKTIDAARLLNVSGGVAPSEAAWEIRPTGTTTPDEADAIDRAINILWLVHGVLTDGDPMGNERANSGLWAVMADALDVLTEAAARWT